MPQIIFRFLGGIGLFLFAIVLINEALTLPDQKVRKLFEKKLQNPFLSLLAGGFFATITQSSSAINSITLKLADKRFIPQKSSYYVVLGTNIGTTVSGYIALLGKVSFTDIIVAALFFSSLIMMIFKSAKIYKVSYFISAVSLIFAGLTIISRCIPDIMQIFDLSIINTNTKISTLFMSIIVTAICQSSALVMVIIVTLSTHGAINLDTAIFMIMGANLGTCSTALLAAIGSTRAGLKVTLFEIILNSLGLLVFVFLYYCGLLKWFIDLNVAQDTKIALFNTIYNIASMLFVIGFVDEIDRFLSYQSLKVSAQ